MTALIQNLPKDCIIQVLSFFPVKKRGNLCLICKLFNAAIKDPFFEKERTEVKLKQQEIVKVASQYPKALVDALGGAKKLYDLPVIELTKEDEKEFFDGRYYNPSRGQNFPFLLFQYKCTQPGILDSVLIKPISEVWKWHAGVVGHDRTWTLSEIDYDWIRRMFSGELCGFRGGENGTENVTHRFMLSMKPINQDL
jgi:hypothetical protein